jgi:hypothetical protein
VEDSSMAALKALVSKGFRSTLLAPELRKYSTSDGSPLPVTPKIAPLYPIALSSAVAVGPSFIGIYIINNNNNNDNNKLIGRGGFGGRG